MWLPTGLSQRPPKREIPAKKRREINQCHSISIPHLSGVSEKFKRILQKHDIPIQSEPSNTLRHKLEHLTKTKQSHVVYAVESQRIARNCTLGILKSPSINEWPNTRWPPWSLVCEWSTKAIFSSSALSMFRTEDAFWETTVMSSRKPQQFQLQE